MENDDYTFEFPTEDTSAAPEANEAPPLASQEAPDENAWRSEFQEQFGMAVDGFSDRQNALAAARMMAEQYAQAGLQYRAAPAQHQATSPPYQAAPLSPGFSPAQAFPSQPAVPPTPYAGQQPAPVPGELDIDEENLDPKFVAKVRALQQGYTAQQQQLQAATQAAEQYRQQFVAFQQQQVERQQAEIFSRATSAIDRLASDKYGVGQTRSYQQQQAVQNLLQTADALIYGFEARGVPVPTIETVLQHALLLDGWDGQPAPSKNGKASGQRSGAGAPLAPRPKRSATTNSDGLNWMDEDEFVAGARAILNRS